jgi:hypothetical protein
MGQAKRRGTFEERKAAAIKREATRKLELEKVRLEREAWWASLSDEERQKYIDERNDIQQKIDLLSRIPMMINS